jgi:hypothetical protein
MGLGASIFNRLQFTETELSLTMERDKSLLAGQVPIADLDSYRVPGMDVQHYPPCKVSTAELACVLVQSAERVQVKHQELLESLQSEIHNLKGSKDNIGQHTPKLQLLCNFIEAVLRNEARQAKATKAWNTKHGEALPLKAQARLRCGIASVLSLVTRAGSPLIYRDVIRIASGVFSKLPAKSLERLDPSLAECLDSISCFLEGLLNVPSLSEQEQLSVLPPLLGLALAKGSTSALLAVASKFLSLPRPQHFEATVQLMQETLIALAAAKPRGQVTFSWEVTNARSNMTFSNENTTISKALQEWGSVLSEQSITEGTHYVEFLIRSMPNSESIMLGVTSPDFNQFASHSIGPKSWVFYNGSAYVNGLNSWTLFDSSSQVDRIGLLIDMNQRQLTFFMNGNMQSKEAFNDLPDEVVLLCSIRNCTIIEINSEPELPAALQGIMRRQPKEILPTKQFESPLSRSISPKAIAGYLLASLDRLNANLMEDLGLTTNPTGCAVQILQTEEGSELWYYNDILHKCVQALRSQSWDECEVLSCLTTVRLVRLFLMCCRSKASEDLRRSVHEVLQELLSLTELPQFNAIRLEVKLTLTHCFEMFFADKLTALTTALKEEGTAHPSKAELQAQLLRKMSLVVNLSMAFEEASLTKIKEFSSVLVDKAGGACMKRVRGETVKEDYIGLLTALIKLLLSKLSKDHDSEFTQFCAEFIDNLIRTTEVLVKEVRLNRAEHRLEDSLLDRVCSTALLSVSLVKPDLKLASRLIDRLLRLLDSLSDDTSSWLDSLRRSTVFTLVQLSKQLIQGNFADGTEPITLSFWASPLIKHGIKDRLPAMLGFPAQLDEGLVELARTLQDVEPPAVLRRSNSSIDLVESKVSASAVKRVLNDYIDTFDSKAKRLANYSEIPILEEFMAGSDRAAATWNELKKRAGVAGPHFNIGGEELEKAERAVFAVYVAFFKLESFLQNFLSDPHDLGRTLRSMVKEANNIRKTAQLLKQKQLDLGKAVSYSQITAQLVEKCVLLLHSEHTQALNQLGVSKVLTDLLPELSRAQAPKAAEGSKWASVRGGVASVSKLMHLLRQSSHSEGDELKEFMRVSHMLTQVLSTDIQSEDLAKALNSRRNRALAMSIGLQSIAHVLKTDRTAEPEVLQAFAEAFRVGNTKYHYSHKLEGIDAGLLEAVQSGFFHLYQLLLNKFNITTSHPATQTYLTAYDALAFPFQAMDSYVLLDLNLVNPLRGLLNCAQSMTGVSMERGITEIRVMSEAEFDSSQEGLSLAVVNRLVQTDFDDGLGDHQRLCLSLRRNTEALAIVEIVVSAAVPEGFEDLGNVNEVGEPMRLCVRRSAEAQKHLVELKVTDYNPIKLTPIFSSEKVASPLQKGAWSLFRSMLYSCAGTEENGAEEVKKGRLLEAFTDTIFEYLQWKPCQQSDAHTLSLGKVTSGRFWQQDSQVIHRTERNFVHDFVSNLRRTVLSVRSLEQGLVEEFLMSIDKYFATFDPAMKGITRRESLDQNLVRELGSELDHMTNQDGQLDFFKFLGLSLEPASDFHALATIVGPCPANYSEAKAVYDNDIKALIEQLASNPSEQSFAPFISLFQRAQERPGIVPKPQVEVPAGFLNAEGDLDLYCALHTIEGSKEYAECWPTCLPSSVLSLYLCSPKEQELQASLLWTLLQASRYTSLLKVLGRPVFVSQLTKHMLFTSNLRVQSIAFQLVSRVVASQHSPQSFECVWESQGHEESTLPRALLSFIGKTLDSSMRRSFGGCEMLKSLLLAERWASEVKEEVIRCLAQYALAAKGVGALKFLAHCVVKDDLSEPLEWSPVLLEKAGITSGVLLKVKEDKLKVFSLQDECLHTELTTHYVGVSPAQLATVFCDNEVLFTALKTTYAALKQASRLRRGSLSQSLAEEQQWLRQLQMTVQITTALVNGGPCGVDDLLKELFNDLTPVPQLQATQKRFKALSKLVLSRHPLTEEIPAESLTVAKTLFRLRKSEEAEFRTINPSATSISQLESGPVIVKKDFLNQERKAFLRKFSTSDLQAFKSFLHEVTFLVSVSLVSPCTEGVFGLLLADIAINVEVVAEQAQVKVGETLLKTGAAESTYSFRVFARWDGRVVVQDYNSVSSEVTLHSDTLYRGVKLGEVGVFLDKGTAAALRGLMVVEGHFVGQINFVEAVPSQELPKVDTHYIPVDRYTVNLTQLRLGALGAPPSAIAEVSSQEFEEALRMLLTSSWPDVLNIDFSNPIELVIVDEVRHLEANDQLLPIFEDGVQVAVSSDINQRRILAARPVRSGQVTIEVSINEGNTEVGELSLPFEGESDYSNKLFVKSVALDNRRSMRALCKAMLVRCIHPNQISLPSGFELVSIEGKAVNLACKFDATKFLFLE